MNEQHPSVVVIAGPNGAGKSTVAQELLRESFAVKHFVNADVIAQGLSGFDPRASALAAGRIMLSRLQSLAEERTSFAFESTLATRTFAPWIANLVTSGYHFHVTFLWLPTPEMAIARVKERVRHGGHDVPEETVRRRFDRGIANLFRLYIPLATSWGIYDNSGRERPMLIASGGHDTEQRIVDASAWRKIRSAVNGA